MTYRGVSALRRFPLLLDQRPRGSDSLARAASALVPRLRLAIEEAFDGRRRPSGRRTYQPRTGWDGQHRLRQGNRALDDLPHRLPVRLHRPVTPGIASAAQGDPVATGVHGHLHQAVGAVDAAPEPAFTGASGMVAHAGRAAGSVRVAQPPKPSPRSPRPPVLSRVRLSMVTLLTAWRGLILPCSSCCKSWSTPHGRDRRRQRDARRSVHDAVAPCREPKAESLPRTDVCSSSSSSRRERGSGNDREWRLDRTASSGCKRRRSRCPASESSATG